MEQEIRTYLESIFKLLLQNDKIKIPPSEISNSWKSVLEEWLNDSTMTLFARKGGEIRGSKIDTFHERVITRTDNTPAHWIFKNLVFDKRYYTKKEIEELILNNQFPISFIRKSNEYETLVDGMVADKNTRLNEQGWKLAHIQRIALKRGANVTIDDYKNHHFNFLDLDNMYLIDKRFSGLAEVAQFNEIIQEYKSKTD